MAVAAEKLTPDAANVASDEFNALLATWRAFDAPEGYRVEISEGAIRMNALPNRDHLAITSALHGLLMGMAPPASQPLQMAGVLMPDADKLYIPDLLVARIEHAAADGTFDPTHVLLVVEVTSPSNTRVDRDEKRDAYAEGGVALYLLVDPVGAHPAVTLHAEPIDGGYRRVTTVPFGESLHLPAPFDVDLDTSLLPQ